MVLFEGICTVAAFEIINQGLVGGHLTHKCFVLFSLVSIVFQLFQFFGTQEASFKVIQLCLVFFDCFQWFFLVFVNNTESVLTTTLGMILNQQFGIVDQEGSTYVIAHFSSWRIAEVA